MEKQKQICLIVVFAMVATLFGVACRAREEAATPLPGVAPAPQRAMPLCWQRPAASTWTQTAAPTRAKSPWRRATS